MAFLGAKSNSTVIDSSCLIHLWNLDLVHRLVIQYNRIYIPQHVKNECGRKGRVRHRLSELIRNYHPFLQVCTVGSPFDAQMLYDSHLNPQATLGRGESEVIIQAREREISTVLIDDRKGKKFAEQHTLQAYDLLDILSRLKRDGIIDEVRPYLTKLGKKYRPTHVRLAAFLRENNEF